jgi:hypothetical protein
MPPENIKFQKDFSLSTYRELIKILADSGYEILTLKDYISIKNPNTKKIILRHDVDRLPKVALKMSAIENEFGLKASYYFRIVSQSFNEKIINRIKDQGHEIGYHYEELATNKGDYEKSIEAFEENLIKIRQLYPVKTMCMHGSPLSKWDNRQMWEKYDYRDFGIIAEPYFDLDFHQVFYITDAGRSWNDFRVNIRDRVPSGHKYEIKSSKDIIDLISRGQGPEEIMINIHPNNWADSTLEWWKIYFWQNFKNLIKRLIYS